MKYVCPAVPADTRALLSCFMASVCGFATVMPVSPTQLPLPLIVSTALLPIALQVQITEPSVTVSATVVGHVGSRAPVCPAVVHSYSNPLGRDGRTYVVVTNRSPGRHVWPRYSHHGIS